MKKGLQEKGMAAGVMLSEFYSPNAAVVFKRGGFDFFAVDCEHGAFDFAMVASMISTAKGCGMTVFIRVPKVDRECILKYLDMGANGLIVPMVSTAEDAQRVVEFAKYPPLGNRGISTNRAHTGYNSSAVRQYIASANEETAILVQIETCQALDKLDAIASVKGIDALIVGPTDLSCSLGVLGDYDSDALSNAVTSVIQSAKSHGLYSGMIASDLSMHRRFRELGMQILCCNSELGMILSKSKEISKRLNELI